MRVNSRSDIGTGGRRIVTSPKPVPKSSPKLAPKSTPKPSTKPTPKTPNSKPAPVVSYGHRVKEEREPQPKVIPKPTPPPKQTPTISYGHRVKEERETQPKVIPKPTPPPKPTPTVSYGHRVKEEREPMPAVTPKSVSHSKTETAISYGQRVVVDKTNSIGIYESHKKTYTEPSGSSMDVKIDGIGKKTENRSIINTVDSGITKENTSKGNMNVVTYSINKGNGYIKSKREEIFAGMKPEDVKIQKETKGNSIAAVGYGDGRVIDKKKNITRIPNASKEKVSALLKEYREGISTKATSDITRESKATFTIVRDSYSKPFRDMINNIPAKKKNSPEIIRAATPKEIKAKERSKILPYIPLVNIVNDVKISLSGTDLYNQCKNEREIMDSKVSTMGTIGTLFAGAVAKSIGTASLSGVDNFANGVSKTTEELSRVSVADKLDRYLLNIDHPVGGSKAKWFRDALGFTKENADDLARQIVFDSETAVQTVVTEHGIKYNQVISITGANGKVIDVTFGWIKNNDGVVRLVTGIPTKK